MRPNFIGVMKIADGAPKRELRPTIIFTKDRSLFNTKKTRTKRIPIPAVFIHGLGIVNKHYDSFNKETIMRKIIIFIVIVTTVLTACNITKADWTGAATIRDETFYVASTGLTLGDWTTVYGGVEGYAITKDFQINMEYQAGILDKDIANINTYLYPANAAFPDDHTDGTWTLNYSDNEEYVFNISLTGGLTIYEYAGMAETVGGSDIKWTLTAWHQTILAGDIIGNQLVVVPTGTYRPFINDPPVNNVEVFDGNLDTEVLAYTFTGDASGIGSGSVLGVVLVPVPAAVLLGILGLGVAGIKLRKFA